MCFRNPQTDLHLSPLSRHSASPRCCYATVFFIGLFMSEHLRSFLFQQEPLFWHVLSIIFFAVRIFLLLSMSLFNTTSTLSEKRSFSLSYLHIVCFKRITTCFVAGGILGTRLSDMVCHAVLRVGGRGWFDV